MRRKSVIDLKQVFGKLKCLCVQTGKRYWDDTFTYSYTKPKGQLPDYTSPVVLPNDRTSVEDFCMKIHKNLIKEFK